MNIETFHDAWYDAKRNFHTKSIITTAIFTSFIKLNFLEIFLIFSKQ